MTVHFSGVNFFYKPDAREKTLIRSCLPDELIEKGRVSYEEKGDVVVVNTGTGAVNPVDEMLIELLTSRGHNDAMTRSKDGDILTVGFRTEGNTRRIVRELMGDNPRPELSMHDSMKPVYFLSINSNGDIPQAEIDRRVEQLNREGTL